MSKTIEERFEEFTAAIDDAPYLAHQPFFDPIIEAWNAAVNELRIIRYTARDDNDGECEMTVAITWAQLARIEAVIKAMNGVLLRDEESFQSLLVEMEGREKTGGFLDTALSRDEEYDPADVFDEEFDGGPEHGGWY